jgi:tRNA(adenine34) deaminase
MSVQPTPTPAASRDAQDAAWMAEALAVAEAAGVAGEVPVGAVVVCRGGRVAAAGNAMRSEGATGHAEMRAITAALAARASERLDGCTMYVTLEPCAMCAGAIVLARFDRVVFGAWDEKAGMGGSVGDILRHPRLNHAPQVQAGVMAAESSALLQRFFQARRTEPKAERR